ncbi:MAG: tetratricopeptide repeat protein [Saprospiraceae bacterium]
MAKSRNHRKGKRRKKSYPTQRKDDWDSSPPTAYVTPIETFKTEFSDQQLIEKRTFIKTAFGDLPYSADKTFFDVSDPRALVELIQIVNHEVTQTEYLIAFEELIQKYPDEPAFYTERTGTLVAMKQTEEAAIHIKKDVARFPNAPAIVLRDLQHRALKAANNAIQRERLIVERLGENHFIGDVFPQELAFNDVEIEMFYNLWFHLFLDRKDWENAQSCIEVFKTLDRGVTTPLLQRKLNVRRNPRLRYRYKVQGILVIALFLGIIVAIIYGVVKFFQWIF